MSSDKSSIIEKAQKLAAKGQIDKAIEEWQKLIAETPNDGNIYNTIGDLHLKANHTKEAIAAYLKAADAFQRGRLRVKKYRGF
ncbi:MAG: tetratricopeptide repeat protein [Candidatus Manganitrophus sp.]|nr:tetratricopeptide repeat protein [Candidatus Manganitrophus sp.]